jgi:hypothetical protein
MIRRIETSETNIFERFDKRSRPDRLDRGDDGP